MPTILDATVVPQAYQTFATARPQRLSNGWIVSAVANGTVDIQFFVSKDNFATPATKLCHFPLGGISASGLSLAHIGTMVYCLVNQPAQTGNYFVKFDASIVTNTAQTNSSLDASQTAFGTCDLTANDTGTELHATWDSKNPTYPNSKNIRYAKGTINADGSVAWGAVSQATTYNAAGTDAKNPSIVIKADGKPAVIHEYASGTASYRIDSVRYDGSVWLVREVVYNAGATYVQSSPSAIFVPQSVNGLANGLIADTWDGFDATHTTTKYIRFSKSLDSGVTWSAMQKLVPGINGTLTANRTGKLFITYDDAGTTKRIESTDNGDTWSSAITVGTGTNPSSLFDLTLSMNISVPLTIRKGATSVLFSGTWTVTTINVTQGSIGQKTSPTPLLTYAITTDGTMSTITEKVNGVTIGTKTATSGQSLIAGLTQAQWDAVKFGKYANATGGANTLTVTMGSEVFTYTFDKRLATDADVLSAVKAMQDADSVAIPAKKALLATAIRAKGGTVNDTDALEVMASAVGTLPLKRYVTGTATSSASTVSFVGGSHYYITVTGLPFKPSNIFIYKDAVTPLSSYSADTPTRVMIQGGTGTDLSGNAYITQTSFQLPVGATYGSAVLSYRIIE